MKLSSRLGAAVAVGIGVAMGLAVGEVVLQLVVRLDLLPSDNAFALFTERGVRTLPGATSLYRYSDDDVLSVELTPDARRGHITINSMGFRGPDYPSSAPPRTTRIVIVGDSETFGAALPERQTLAGSLQAVLNDGVEGAGTSDRYEVLNLGFPGYNMEQNHRSATTRALALEPDIVLLYYVLNDPITPGISSIEQLSLLDGVQLVAMLRWLYHSFIPSAYFYRDTDRDARMVSFYHELHQGQRWDRCAALIRDMASTTRAHGARFVLVIAPELVGFDDFAEYPYGDLHATLRGLESDAVEVLDPLAALSGSGQAPRTFWVSNIDVHKNAKANGLIAAWLAPRLFGNQPGS